MMRDNDTKVFSELFYSFQGEGKYAGVPSIFIRMIGCNLFCDWCDSKFASWEPEKPSFSLNDVDEFLGQHKGVKHVVITGGEPLANMALFIDLLRLVKSKHKFVTVETNGTIMPPTELPCSVDLISISPKLFNSIPVHDERRAELHKERRYQPTAILRWGKVAKDFQLKFVVSSERDMEEISEIISGLCVKPSHVYLMPEGKTNAELARKRKWVADLCLKYHCNYCDRLHVIVWGDKRGV